MTGVQLISAQTANDNEGKTAAITEMDSVEQPDGVVAREALPVGAERSLETFVQSKGKRLFDILAALALCVLTAPLLAMLMILVRMTSKGPALYWSERVGRNNRLFLMPKFRSMRTDTPQIATHLLVNAEEYLTPIGGFLRRASLDEVPQLFSILRGDLSFVGPRPALFNQTDLVALRTGLGIHRLVPGLTGWAQVNGRDELPIPEKVRFDCEYMQRQSFKFDLQIMMLTVVKVIRREGIRH
ncbi:MAG TPA: sugar transferase [Terracidiphilus sp.]|nr:sugar transferase [Terracidiphilus sp.]